MQPGHRYCNVTFDGQTFCIPLPDAVPHNFHTFIREELIAAGVHNLSNKALQVGRCVREPYAQVQIPVRPRT